MSGKILETIQVSRGEIRFLTMEANGQEYKRQSCFFSLQNDEDRERLKELFSDLARALLVKIPEKLLQFHHLKDARVDDLETVPITLFRGSNKLRKIDFHLKEFLSSGLAQGLNEEDRAEVAEALEDMARGLRIPLVQNTIGGGQ